MAKVVITRELEDEINKRFKKESVKIFQLLYSLREYPKKGKIVGNIGSIIIKEVKYSVYRFYFITDGYRVKIMKNEELTDLLIKFVRMSDKDKQQKVIDEIKDVLRKMGSEGF
ncbi:MAG: hypothetical protein KAK00_10070 [Nanoarchaeota archaeon]|nr:hypothetical protein [Nanoarchaeota archaeon]